MRGQAWEGKLPKAIDRASPGRCKACKKNVHDIDAHNQSIHKKKASTRLPKTPR